MSAGRADRKQNGENAGGVLKKTLAKTKRIPALSSEQAVEMPGSENF